MAEPKRLMARMDTLLPMVLKLSTEMLSLRRAEARMDREEPKKIKC